MTAEQLSYGHSSAVVQGKAEFVNGVMTRKATVKTIEFPELKVAIVGSSAIARHLYVSDSETDGKPNNVKIGVLAVWQKQDGVWKLLARQAISCLGSTPAAGRDCFAALEADLLLTFGQARRVAGIG